MMLESGVVIVGAGLAGAEAAFALREFGYMGPVLMIGGETWPPYDRPPLSKTYLSGEHARSRLWLQPDTRYADERIDLRLGTTVTAIDSTRRQIVLAHGEPVRYDKLILATGGDARSLPLPGAELDGVHTLKTLADADGIAQAMGRAPRVVVIGGGYVGMEFAASAHKAGCAVTIVESQQRVLARSLSPTISAHLQQAYQRLGIGVITGSVVAQIEGASCVEAVVLADGRCLPADLVLIGIGNDANDGLARESGIDADRGILVDADCRTSDPHVFAVGDCTIARHDGFVAPIRLESVQNARAQARRAAAAICGAPSPAAEVPWFWSDQFDIRLQMAGLPLPGDTEIVRGDPALGIFSVIFQNASRMTAIQCVNASRDFSAGKRLIAERRTFPEHLLSDTSTALKDVRLQQDS